MSQVSPRTFKITATAASPSSVSRPRYSSSIGLYRLGGLRIGWPPCTGRRRARLPAAERLRAVLPVRADRRALRQGHRDEAAPGPARQLPPATGRDRGRRRGTGRQPAGEHVEFDRGLGLEAHRRTVADEHGYARPGAAARTFSFAQTKARYVKITGTRLGADQFGDHYLQLGEIGVS
ncbi:hypothetical protein [Streptomyces sp. NPDC051079]|uniref:hypothetical protein n=1 Tax=Streptomyces sp. NPDC051079 TaxID=3155043 RepID=UPI00344EE0CC